MINTAIVNCMLIAMPVDSSHPSSQVISSTENIMSPWKELMVDSSNYEQLNAAIYIGPKVQGGGILAKT